MYTRRDRALYVATLVALCAAALVPIWRPRLLPLLDQPNHLAAIQVWNQLSNTSWHFRDFYDYSRVPVPYWGYYLPVHLLSYAMNIELANKLFLSAYVVSLPLSVWCLARALDKSPVAALFTIPFLFNDSWAWGFLSYTPGVSLLFFGLAALVAFFRTPTASRAALFFALLLATYFMHFLAWAALCVFAALYTLGQWDKRRPFITAWALLVTSAIACAADTIYCSQTSRTVGKHLTLRAGYESTLDSVHRFAGRLISYWPNGAGDTATLAVLLGALIALLITQARRTNTNLTWYERIREHYVGLCVLVALILYFTTPLKLVEPVWIYHVNTRYAVLVPLFMALMLRDPVSGVRRALVAVAVVVSLYYPVALSSRYVAFNERAAPMFALIDRIPVGSSTLTLLFGTNEDVALDPAYVPWNEFHSYPEVFRGGFNPFGWHLGFPFVVNKPLPTPRWNDPSTFRQETHGRFFDYVLTRNEPADRHAFAPDTHVEMIGKSGDFRLYKTRNVPK